MKMITHATVAALMLGGCASMGTNYNEAVAASLQPGMAYADVVKAMGPPNSRSTMPNGQTVVLWLHSQANGFTGHSQARSVSYLFDADGRLVREINSGQTQGRF